MQNILRQALLLNSYEQIISKLYIILSSINTQKQQMQMKIQQLEKKLAVKDQKIKQLQQSIEQLNNTKSIKQNHVSLATNIKSQPLLGIQQQLQNEIQNHQYEKNKKVNINDYFLSLIQNQQISNKNIQCEQGILKTQYKSQKSIIYEVWDLKNQKFDKTYKNLKKYAKKADKYCLVNDKFMSNNQIVFDNKQNEELKTTNQSSSNSLQTVDVQTSFLKAQHDKKQKSQRLIANSSNYCNIIMNTIKPRKVLFHLTKYQFSKC